MLTVKEAQNGYLTHFRRYAHKTQKNYAGVIRRFLDSIPKSVLVKNITAEHIERFILSGNYKASSRNVLLFSLRNFFSWVELTYGIESAAAKVKKLKTLPPYQRILSREEYTKLIESATGYTQDVIRFLANTGLRADEFLSLRPENINGEFITIIGKGGKRRAISINATVRTILESNPHIDFRKSNNDAWLFRLCRRAAKTANIKPFSAKSLRHYFADSLHNAGKPIGVIAKLMGHSSPLITMSIYVHWQDADLTGATDCLD